MKNKKTNHDTLWFARLLDNEKWSAFSIPAFSIVLSFIFASAVLLLMGKNPITAYASFLQGCGFLPKPNYGNGSGMLTDFFSFLNILAPMLLASLGFIVSYKAGLFNIGISGQMLLSGFLATVIVGYSGLSAALAKPLVILVGIVAGALLGAFIGFLKYKFNINEVVSTIMLNYIIRYLTGFFINGYFANPLTRSMNSCTDEARLTWTNVQIGGVRCNVPLGLVLALLAVFVVKFIFDKTVFGFELKAVGSNANCAKYAGMKVSSRIVLSLMISGALAGLAGVTYYCGYFNTIVPKNLSSLGYDGISVALLGNSSPLGAIFASILITVFQNGGSYMSSTLGVAKEISSFIIGILLLFSACGEYFRYVAHRKLQKAADQSSACEVAVSSPPTEVDDANKREE